MISLKKILNEAKFKSPDYIISTTPASKISPIRLAHADVSVGLKMADKLKNYTLNVRHFKLVHANGKVALKLTPEGKTAVRVRTENDPKYLQLIQKTVNDVVADYANDIKESVNEALDSKAEKFLDAIQVNDRSIKDLKNITVDATPQGNWSVYYKGKRMFTLNGKMLDDKTIMKYGLEHMDESLSEGKKIQKSVNEATVRIKKTISKQEWDKIPKYNKHIGQDGTKYIMQYSDNMGTYLQGVNVSDGKYYVGYNKGRGQGTGVFKDVFTSYDDAKKEVEKTEKLMKGGSNMTAYYVADKDGNPIRESVNEAKSDYEVYHKSYTSAIEAAREYAEKKGYEINNDDAFTKIGMGPRKPSEGKTNRFDIELSKDGKVQRKKLQIQVYGMRNSYELNAYIQ